MSRRALPRPNSRSRFNRSAVRIAFTKAALKLFPALVLGNTVVHKPAHETPLIGAAVQQMRGE